ncbi:hypothetical protein M501DRAFT_287708 [Patellaria atrata CBS 101060]|uniref:Uncharacterized protein n=1 Tax=Patellaria atrata CBS 101060 TaxID=1346257 RepID=A0A9P4VK98_9PEZI|nr:hypothetical protein M501DRAFT_287708 [Patellaria atrata CBS 101060]
MSNPKERVRFRVIHRSIKSTNYAPITEKHFVIPLSSKIIWFRYLFYPQTTPLFQQISQRLLAILRFGYLFSVALQYI